MTEEEAKKLSADMYIEPRDVKAQHNFIHRLFKYFKSELKAKDERIAELTQEKNCEGCVYEKEKGKHFNLACSKCMRGYPQDHYTPKK